ncbi:MAG: hypothetical protein ACLRMJ_07500 [Alistipes finegoldii]
MSVPDGIVHGYIYNDDETKLHNGAPSFDGSLSAHYDGRKISFGAGVYLPPGVGAVFEYGDGNCAVNL